jgi:hypothetical protein
LLLRERFEPRANWSASYCARPLVFRTVLICEVRSFGEKCRLQRQITGSSAISSTVIQLEGLSLLGILRPVDRVRWQTALPDGGESVLSTPLKIRILGIEKRNLRSRLRGCRLALGYQNNFRSPSERGGFASCICDTNGASGSAALGIGKSRCSHVDSPLHDSRKAAGESGNRRLPRCRSMGATAGLARAALPGTVRI